MKTKRPPGESAGGLFAEKEYGKDAPSMPELTDLSTIRALCEKYDFSLSKGY